MRITSKNLIQAIIQALSMLILFMPCIYTEEIWLDISGHGGEYQLKHETTVSFFRKLTILDEGQFLGILTVCLMVILMILLIAQIAKQNHIQIIPVIALTAAILFFFYSLTCTEEPWDSGWGPSVYYAYTVSFGFILILALQLTMVLIGFISNSRIKQNGLIEEKNSQYIQNNISNADELGKYKELLDKGAITQDEFEVKKEQLLEL